MNDSPIMIPPTILQLKSQEIQFAERRLATQLAKLEAQASSNCLESGRDRGQGLSWWRYY